jgi:hypothetical protein
VCVCVREKKLNREREKEQKIKKSEREREGMREREKEREKTTKESERAPYWSANARRCFWGEWVVEKRPSLPLSLFSTFVRATKVQTKSNRAKVMRLQ